MAVCSPATMTWMLPRWGRAWARTGWPVEGRRSAAPARLLRRRPTSAAGWPRPATWMVRDLINTPANLLGPVELADFAVRWRASRRGSRDRRGRRAGEAYPTVAAVGAARASAAGGDIPLARQHRACGAAGIAVRQRRLFRYRRIRPETIRRHAADEEGHGRRRNGAGPGSDDHGGGPAGAARGADRLRRELRLRPGDAASTSSHSQGLTVEVGNTDAEGRLVLCDLLPRRAREARPPDRLRNADRRGARGPGPRSAGAVLQR